MGGELAPCLRRGRPLIGIRASLLPHPSPATLEPACSLAVCVATTAKQGQAGCVSLGPDPSEHKGTGQNTACTFQLTAGQIAPSGKPAPPSARLAAPRSAESNSYVGGRGKGVVNLLGGAGMGSTAAHTFNTPRFFHLSSRSGLRCLAQLPPTRIWHWLARRSAAASARWLEHRSAAAWDAAGVR